MSRALLPLGSDAVRRGQEARAAEAERRQVEAERAAEAEKARGLEAERATEAKRKQAEAEAQLARETELREEAKRKQMEAEYQLIREKRLRSRLRFALVGMTVLLFLALGAVVIAFQQKRRADVAAQRAETASEVALSEKERAVVRQGEQEG